MNHQTKGTLGNPKMKIKTCHRPNENFSKSVKWHQCLDVSSEASAGLTSYQTHLAGITLRKSLHWEEKRYFGT